MAAFKRIKNVKWKASYTVESSMIFPIIFACLFLLILVCFLLHDVVILNAAAVERVYEETCVMENQLYTLDGSSFLEKKDFFYRNAVWNKTCTLPMSRYLSLVIKKTTFDINIRARHSFWSTEKIVRYLGKEQQKKIDLTVEETDKKK